MSDEQKAGIPAPLTPFRPEMAFPFLTEEMVERLRAYGREEVMLGGVKLYSRGEREVDLFVVLDGLVRVFTHEEDGEQRQLTTIEALQFSGELDLLSSRPTLVNAETLQDTVVLRIERSELQRLMRSEGDIANLIMQATIWRRLGIMERAAGGIVLIGHSGAAETIALQRFLTRNTYPHRLLEPTPEQFANSGEDEGSVERFLLPAVLLADGHILHRPTIADLADHLGLTEQLDTSMTYDVTVVGAGPSGLAAAVYAASEGLRTLVVEGTAPGGQAGTSSKIENYLGFPTGVSGQELANRALVQAQKFGARMAISRDMVRIDQVDGVHELILSDGMKVRSRSVVIATGRGTGSFLC